MKFNCLVVFALCIGPLSSAAIASTVNIAVAESAILPGEYSGYIISTLQPGTKMGGKNVLARDGSFEYLGDNGIKFSGRLDASNPKLVTGIGTTTLPKAFGLFQLQYADGSINTQLTFRGSYSNGVFKGTYASRY